MKATAWQLGYVQNVCRRAVAEAAAAVERRWRPSTLRVLDPALAQQLEWLQGRWSQAQLESDRPEEIEACSAALCAAWKDAGRRLEEAGVPDDAYILCTDVISGCVVALVLCAAAEARVLELHPGAVIMAPQELAALVLGDRDAAVRSAQMISRTQEIWPGAALVAVQPKAAADVPVEDFCPTGEEDELRSADRVC